MSDPDEPPSFHDVRMAGARFHLVDLSDARFEQVDLTRAQMRGVELVDVCITGEIRNVTINGVQVGPLIDAELDRRDPDRVKMRPADPEGFREAWRIIERRWDGTVQRARGLDPQLLHASVDGEWSFIQTLRHLAFATDAWVRRAMLGDPSPWHPLDLPFDGMQAVPGIPWDRDARPPLEEVLALRADRMASVRRVLDDLTADRLDAHTEPVEAPGWPGPVSYPVRECLQIILDEEYMHRQYAERDLDALALREPADPGA